MPPVFKGSPVTGFSPDSGKLTFTFSLGSKKVTAPVVGWAIIEGALEPVVLADGQVFSTVTAYVAELSSELPEGQTGTVSFEETKPLMPKPAGPKKPKAEFKA